MALRAGVFRTSPLLLLAWVGVLAEETVRTYRLSLIRPMEKEKEREKEKGKDGSIPEVNNRVEKQEARGNRYLTSHPYLRLVFHGSQ